VFVTDCHTLAGATRGPYDAAMNGPVTQPMRELRRFDARSDAEDVAAAVRDDGACIIERLASGALLDRFTAEMAPWTEHVPPGEENFAGTRTRRAGALIARSPAARELVMDPLVLGIVPKVIAKHTAFQLHLTQTIAIGPGETSQPIHRDQWAWDFFPFPSGFDVQCNTIWALTDFTEENGATRVVPGSNNWDDKLRIDPADTVAATMSRGSVLLYSGSVYHGGGANRSGAFRVGINITYCLGWLRQEENQYLSCPPDIARTLDPELLRLMGYRHGAYALGYADDLRDPLDALMKPDVLAAATDAAARGFRSQH
jgi:ectoine hydroxylase-related dioxygenase (phytanoyl-CoA dioxygenase family)